MLGKDGQRIDEVWYRKKESTCHGVKHSGDNRTGEGKGDDETILINLDKVSRQVHSLWAVITIYTDGD